MVQEALRLNDEMFNEKKRNVDLLDRELGKFCSVTSVVL